MVMVMIKCKKVIGEDNKCEDRDGNELMIFKHYILCCEGQPPTSE